MTAGRSVHGVALALAVDADGPLFGALLLGAPGAGKSTLALAAIVGCPWLRTALVADDVVVIDNRAGGVEARGTGRLAGLIEVRGFGPAPVRRRDSVPLAAAFDLESPVTRFEDARFDPLDTARLLPIYPFRPGTDGAARLRVAARAILARTGAA